MDAVVTAITIAIALIFAGVVLLAVEKGAADGSLPPNSLVGLRTRATRRNEAAWHAGHVAARPSLYAAGIACIVVAIALVAEAVFLHGHGDVAVGVIAATAALGIGIVLGLVVHATRLANEAARQEPDTKLG